MGTFYDVSMIGLVYVFLVTLKLNFFLGLAYYTVFSALFYVLDYSLSLCLYPWYMILLWDGIEMSVYVESK